MQQTHSSVVDRKAEKAVLPKPEVARQCRERANDIKNYIEGLLPSHLDTVVDVIITQQVPTACVAPKDPDALVEIENADISYGEAQKFTRQCDGEFIVLITGRETNLDDICLDDQLTADLSKQYALALHELLHILKTSFKPVNDLVEEEVEQKHQETVLELINITEDGAIENEAITGNIFTDQSANRLTLAREIYTQSPEEAIKNNDGQVTINFSRAMFRALSDKIIYDSRFTDILRDESDDRIVFEGPEHRTAFEKFYPEIDPLRKDIFALRSDNTDSRYTNDKHLSYLRAKRTVEFWKDVLEPLLSSDDQSQSQQQQGPDQNQDGGQNQDQSTDQQDQQDSSQDQDQGQDQDGSESSDSLGEDQDQQSSGGDQDQQGQNQDQSPLEDEDLSSEDIEVSIDPDDADSEYQSIASHPDIDTDASKEDLEDDIEKADLDLDVDLDDIEDSNDDQSADEDSQDESESDTEQDQAGEDGSSETDDGSEQTGDDSNSSEGESDSESSQEGSDESVESDIGNEDSSQSETDDPVDGSSGQPSTGSGLESDKSESEESEQSESGGESPSDGADSHESEDSTQQGQSPSQDSGQSENSGQSSLADFASSTPNNSDSNPDGEPESEADSNAQSDPTPSSNDPDNQDSSNERSDSNDDATENSSSDQTSDESDPEADSEADSPGTSESTSEESEDATEDDGESGEPAHSSREPSPEDFKSDQEQAHQQAENNTIDEEELKRDLEQLEQNLNEDNQSSSGAGNGSLGQLEVLPEPTQFVSEDWDEIKQQSMGTADTLAKTLNKDRQTKRRVGVSSGTQVNRRTAYKLGQGDPNIFERKIPGREKEYFVVIVLDRSSSMSGSKINVAVKAVSQFATACEDLGIDVAIIDFINYNPRYIKPPSVEMKHVLDRTLSTETSGGTPLKESLELAHNISKDDRKQSIVVSITDDLAPDVDGIRNTLSTSLVPTCSLTIATTEEPGQLPEKAQQMDAIYDQSATVFNEENLTQELDFLASLLGNY